MKFLKKLVGIYLERKKKTAYLNIEKMKEVSTISLPLYGDLKKIVVIGQQVKKGEAIAEGIITPSLHSPVSGEVKEFVQGKKDKEGYELIISIKNDFEELSAENNKNIDYDKIKINDFFEIIKEKGIVGMGGAGYPSYLKIKKSYENKNKIMVVNACECEPYFNCDNRLVQEKAKEIVEGIVILMKKLELENVIIAIEDNKKEAILELRKAIKNYLNIQIKTLKRIYPLGEERILIRALFNKEISKSSYPVEEGYLIHNVATIFSIYEAISLGKPLIDRVITVAGEGVKENKNLKVKIGTRIKDIAAYCNMQRNVEKIIIGGPMTGKSVYSVNNGIIGKNNGGILFLSKEEINSKPVEPCIYCGTCVDKCPMGLLPLKFEELVRVGEMEELEEIKIFDCIECGVCSYVCPSKRPLVEGIIIGKKILKEVQK